MTSPFTPDLEQAQKHLRLLDREAEAFVFQTFDDLKSRSDRGLARTLHGSLKEVAPELIRLQARGAGVYVTVNSTRGGRRRKKDVVAARAVFREADEPNLPPLPLEPHFIVETSPGRCHEYLKIVPDRGLDRWEGIMLRMVEDYGSDPCAKDLARVLRLAGFYHIKDPASPHMVKIVRESGADPYTLERVATAIPPIVQIAPKANPTTRTFTGDAGTPYGLAALKAETDTLASTPPDTKRNHQLNASAFVCAQLAAGGELAPAHARREIMAAALASGLPAIEAQSTLESGWEAGLKEPRTAPEKSSSVATPLDATGPIPLPDKIRAVSIAEFLSLVFPPRENVLDPWLPTQGLAMIHAKRGVGKTHVGLGIAVAVASGGKFLRWTAPKPRGVLYIDGEMPAVVMQERISQIIASTDNELTAPLNIITPDLQPGGMPNLTTEEGQEAIEDHLEGISLVIVDNISTLCRGGRENEAESWLPVQEWALRLRTRDLSVLFIHHAGKGGAQRGTSRREDILDTVINLKHAGDYNPDQGACFEVHFEKARGIYGDEVKPFEAKLSSDQNGKQEWTIKDLDESTTEKVADLLNDRVPQSEIAELLGVAKGTVSKHKKKAKNLGLIK